VDSPGPDVRRRSTSLNRVGCPRSTAMLDRARPSSNAINIVQKWRRRESNGGPAILPEDVGAIGSAVSREESAGWAEERESGSTPEDAGGSDACSRGARAPTAAELLATVQAAIEALETGDVDAAGARLRSLAADLRASVTAGTPVALLRLSQ
jgi:hypothetical protein